MNKFLDVNDIRFKEMPYNQQYEKKMKRWFDNPILVWTFPSNDFLISPNSTSKLSISV